VQLTIARLVALAADLVQRLEERQQFVEVFLFCFNGFGTKVGSS